MASKNADYCGGSSDPFANFRISEVLGIHPALGIMMRMTDKMQRIKSFVANGTLAVKSESFEDACDDLVNYAILLKGILIDTQDVGADTPSNSEAEELRRLILAELT